MAAVILSRNAVDEPYQTRIFRRVRVALPGK